MPRRSIGQEDRLGRNIPCDAGQPVEMQTNKPSSVFAEFRSRLPGETDKASLRPCLILDLETRQSQTAV